MESKRVRGTPAKFLRVSPSRVCISRVYIFFLLFALAFLVNPRLRAARTRGSCSHRGLCERDRERGKETSSATAESDGQQQAAAVRPRRRGDIVDSQVRATRPLERTALTETLLFSHTYRGYVCRAVHFTVGVTCIGPDYITCNERTGARALHSATGARALRADMRRPVFFCVSI